jgi:predicted DNA-binding transcriptional regulator YafY
MRADRLLSILMILQAQGKVTVRDLAEELEVSERTIYRDITALSVSGVPIYTERGPGGGVSLIERYRTDLTGLSKDEVRALFMLSIPTPLTELGVGRELKTALHKLAAAIPSSYHSDEVIARQRIHLDWSPWFREEESLQHLETIQRAMWSDRKLCLRYWTQHMTWLGPLETVVSPYGLVAKAGVWYLICATEDHLCVIRVSWVIEAQQLEEEFVYPEDFDLVSYWTTWCRKYEENRPYFSAQVRVSPKLHHWLPDIFGDDVREEIERADPPDEDGWITLSLTFETLESARKQLMNFGRSVEVLSPPALRSSLVDYAHQILHVYERD